MRPSRRALAIKPSATLELAARAAAMKAAGEDVINLSVGEPDFDTPEPVIAAAHRALDEGHFHYTPTPGIMALRQGIADRYRERLGLDLAASQVIVSHGAKQALFNALATCTDPGDRVGILIPGWVTYLEQAHALGCEPVLIDCPAETRFRPDLDQLRAAVREGLRVLVLNSPSNPTGAAYTADELAEIVDILRDSNTLLLSDEIYEDILFDGRDHVSPFFGDAELMGRGCLVSGFSKAFAMTGWRIGFSIADATWTKSMSSLQGHVTSGINAITQQAALTALQRWDCVPPMCAAFEKRRDHLVGRMSQLPGVRAEAPEGTFYLYFGIADCLGDGGLAADVDDLAARILEEQRVVLVPGAAFGGPSSLRLSFAASVEELDRAVDRLAQIFV
jgi:aspartate aminotransferase